MLRRFLTENC